MPTRRSLLLATPALLVTAPALAHHGWSSFDRSQTLDHAGPVLRATWANPHGTVVLARDGRELTFDLAPVTRMQARGLTEVDISAGRTVRLLAYRHIEIPTLYRAEWIETGGRRVELR